MQEKPLGMKEAIDAGDINTVKELINEQAPSCFQVMSSADQRLKEGETGCFFEKDGALLLVVGGTEKNWTAHSISKRYLENKLGKKKYETFKNSSEAGNKLEIPGKLNRRLVNWPLDTHLHDKHLVYPLEYAVIKGNLEIVKLLLNSTPYFGIDEARNVAITRKITYLEGREVEIPNNSAIKDLFTTPEEKMREAIRSNNVENIAHLIRTDKGTKYRFIKVSDCHGAKKCLSKDKKINNVAYFLDEDGALNLVRRYPGETVRGTSLCITKSAIKSQVGIKGYNALKAVFDTESSATPEKRAAEAKAEAEATLQKLNLTVVNWPYTTEKEGYSNGARRGGGTYDSPVYPLQLAVQKNNLSIVKQLLANGAYFNRSAYYKKARYGFTYLSDKGNLEDNKLYFSVETENGKKKLFYSVKGVDGATEKYEIKAKDADNDEKFISRLATAINKKKINPDDKKKLLNIASERGHCPINPEIKSLLKLQKYIHDRREESDNKFFRGLASGKFSPFSVFFTKGFITESNKGGKDEFVDVKGKKLKLAGRLLEALCKGGDDKNATKTALEEFNTGVSDEDRKFLTDGRLGKCYQEAMETFLLEEILETDSSPYENTTNSRSSNSNNP